MDPFEQKEVLSTFRILIDTREQNTDRARRRYNTFGVPYGRATLAYGDYTYNCDLPDGGPLLDDTSTVWPPVVVERKMDLDELAGCLGRDRKRFEREFKRASEEHARIFLIVENASWENLLLGHYRSKLNPNAYFSSLVAWMHRYDLVVIMCKEETSGRMIKEILYRDLKERLERGEFG